MPDDDMTDTSSAGIADIIDADDIIVDPDMTDPGLSRCGCWSSWMRPS